MPIRTICDANGATPFHLAVLNGHTSAVEALLKFGADPNASNGYDEPVISDIQDACTLPSLLAAGATRTPKVVDRLMYDAIRFGSADIIDVLFEHGVKPRKWHIEVAREE